MRSTLKKEFKEYLEDYPEEIRKSKGLTQQQMSEHLCMDVRSYVDLEHKKSAFSLVSFALLLSELDDEKYYLIDDLMTIVKNVKDGGK